LAEPTLREQALFVVGVPEIWAEHLVLDVLVGHAALGQRAVDLVHRAAGVIIQHYGAERHGQGQQVTYVDRVVQQGGYLSVGTAAAVHSLDRELAVLAVVGPA
jgi:hypothetical protein